MTNSANKIKGNIGENIACEYLEKLGYKIIERNWHYSKNAEIDIIATDKKTLVFVEVKFRSSIDFGHPFEAINKAKLNKIFQASQAYLQQTNQKFSSYRYDGISIIGKENPKIEHLKNLSLQ